MQHEPCVFDSKSPIVMPSLLTSSAMHIVVAKQINIASKVRSNGVIGIHRRQRLMTQTANTEGKISKSREKIKIKFFGRIRSNWKFFRGVWQIFGNKEGKSETGENSLLPRGDGRPCFWMQCFNAELLPRYLKALLYHVGRVPYQGIAWNMKALLSNFVCTHTMQPRAFCVSGPSV